MQLSDYENFLRKNVPLIDFSGLIIHHIDAEKCIVKMPFTAQNKNHVQSMYLGSLVIGAEVSAGILAFHLIHEQQVNSTVVFKNFAASFLRLAQQDVYFECVDSDAIRRALAETTATGKRVNFPVKVVAVEELSNMNEPVASFEMTVSVKIINPC